MTRTAVRPGRGPGSPGVPVSGRRASAAGGVGSPGTEPKRGRFAMDSASVRAASSSGVRDWRAASSARSAASSSESLTVMPVAVRLLHRSESVSARSLSVTAYVGIRSLPHELRHFPDDEHEHNSQAVPRPAGCAGVRGSLQVQK
jgi:hypothetical protein